MNQPDHEKWRERLWRQNLTPEQLAELRAANPDAAEVDLEAALSDALKLLPDAPAPSNFTARVLQGLEHETLPAARRVRDSSWLLRVLVPRAAVAMAVIGLGAFAFRQHGVKRTARMAESLRAVAAVQIVPSPEALENFDVIEKLDSNPAADKELIALLQ